MEIHVNICTSQSNKSILKRKKIRRHWPALGRSATGKKENRVRNTLRKVMSSIVTWKVIRP